MTPYQFGQFVKQAIDYTDLDERINNVRRMGNNTGRYVDGIRTHDAAGQQLPLNAQQTQQVQGMQTMGNRFSRLGAAAGGQGRANMGTPPIPARSATPSAAAPVARRPAPALPAARPAAIHTRTESPDLD